MEPGSHSPSPQGPQPRTYSQLRGQGTVGQQRHVCPEPGVGWRGLNGQHLHTCAWLGSHCGGRAASGGRASPASSSPRQASGGTLDAPNSDTFSHFASKSPSRSHSWHCLARRSQSLTCSTPMSRRPECSVRVSGPCGALSYHQVPSFLGGGPSHPATGYRAGTPGSLSASISPSRRTLDLLTLCLVQGLPEQADLVLQSNPGGRWNQPTPAEMMTCHHGTMAPRGLLLCRKAVPPSFSLPPQHRGLTCVQVLQQGPKGQGIDL